LNRPLILAIRALDLDPARGLTVFGQAEGVTAAERPGATSDQP
jgi:hypothetical protein